MASPWKNPEVLWTESHKAFCWIFVKPEFGSGYRHYRNQKGYVVAVLLCISEHITNITACQYATPAREPIWFRVSTISEPNKDDQNASDQSSTLSSPALRLAQLIFPISEQSRDTRAVDLGHHS
jgi:hypothetical protein